MMRPRLALFLASLALSAACAERTPDVIDAYGYLPLVDDGPAVAYFMLRNPTARRLEVSAIACPPFARVELHETRLEDGVSRMRRLGSPAIEPGGKLELRPGGTHLMLMQAPSPIEAGAACSLAVRLADGSVLATSVKLSERGTGGPGS